MVIKRDFMFAPAEEMRTLHIYLPDSYEDSEERYPVVYFLDGHNLFFDKDATYGKSWGVKEFLDQWEKPIIIVGIECGHGPGQRLSEYCPYTVDRRFLKGVVGTGDVTFRWIIDEVKPMIDKEYRTWWSRECTAIAGSSMGGLMAWYGVTKYNDCFSKAACISSSIIVCMDEVEREMKECPVDPDTRVFLSWGTREARAADHEHEDFESEMSKCNRYVAKVLEEQGAAVEVYCQIGGGHCEADWEKLVPEFMDFLWMR